MRTLHFNKDYTNFHDSPLPKAKLLHAYRKAHKLLHCISFFLLHSEVDPRPYHAACILHLPTEIWTSVSVCFYCCKPFYVPDVVSPLEILDILVLANAVLKEFAEINTSHHVSTDTDNYSWVLNMESMCYLNHIHILRENVSEISGPHSSNHKERCLLRSDAIQSGRISQKKKNVKYKFMIKVHSLKLVIYFLTMNQKIGKWQKSRIDIPIQFVTQTQN